MRPPAARAGDRQRVPGVLLSTAATSVRRVCRVGATDVFVESDHWSTIGLARSLRADDLPAVDGCWRVDRQAAARARGSRGRLDPAGVLYVLFHSRVFHRLTAAPPRAAVDKACSRSASWPCRRPVSGVRAARATTSRVPTITVAIVARVTAVYSISRRRKNAPPAG